MGSCVLGRQIWLEEEERHREKGPKVGLGLWQCGLCGVFILGSSKHLCVQAGWRLRLGRAPRSTSV